MELAKKAREVAPLVATATAEQKNAALRAIKAALIAKKGDFEKANQIDLAAAKKAVDEGKLEAPLYERLNCTGVHYNDILTGIDDVLALDDPVGLCTMSRQMCPDLNLYRVTCPIGVLLVIFESRPDACVQILTLALKSGNAVILKGGKEAKNSLHSIKEIVNEALRSVEGIPEGTVQLADTREDVAALLKMDEYVDLVVPRGSNELVRYIKDTTTIPVLGHADGLCMTYVDKDLDMDQAIKCVEDAKLQYTAACNAVETLIVHKDIAPTFLPKLAAHLKSNDVKYRADPTSMPLLPSDVTTAATEKDFKTEYLDKIMAIKTVNNVDEAIYHINTHGSHHTDAILTNNSATADRFMRGVDSSGVYVNCSTRFADGFRYGFGAEVGISTNRIHARGPVGLEGLVTYRYRLYGKGQRVGQFAESAPAPEKLKYDHKDFPLEKTRDTDAIAAAQKSFFSK